MLHWLLHVLGIDTQQSPWYDFWSGVGTQFRPAALLLPYVLYRRHNCHQRRCWRVGRHQVDGTPWCNHHHHEARRPGTVDENVLRFLLAYNEYVERTSEESDHG